jgi:ABC-type dipeptide/oligopeptide/nickel transport systems, permease components
MKKFFLIRFVKAVITIWFILSLVFVFTRMSGDPTRWILPDDAPDQVRVELRQTLGLDRPIAEQYVNSLLAVFRGDMGKSYYYLRPVGELFAQAIGPTLKLGITAFLLATVLGVPLGVLAAVKRNSFLDRLTMGITIAGYTIPDFVFSILLVFLFSLKLKLLPSGGAGTLAHFVMPVMALAVGPTASIARLTRSSMLDVLRQEYLDCARAKGVREIAVVFKHALRNALIPVVTIIGIQMGAIIGGAVVVETVFAWPGVGSLIVSAAKNRDFPVVQYGVMLISIAVTFTNMLVDLSYAFLDPRVRNNY